MALDGLLETVEAVQRKTFSEFLNNYLQLKRLFVILINILTREIELTKCRFGSKSKQKLRCLSTGYKSIMILFQYNEKILTEKN